MISQQHEESIGGDTHPGRSWQLASDHTRIRRAVVGRGLTIDPLPDNMSRIVVSTVLMAFIIFTAFDMFYLF